MMTLDSDTSMLGCFILEEGRKIPEGQVKLIDMHA